MGVSVRLPIPSEDPSKPRKMALTEVRVLESGSSFGELALISNKPRAATVIAKEDTHLACLEKQDFDRILSKYCICQHQINICTMDRAT